MPREFSRTVRVAESIKRVLAPLVNDWMREHQLGMASVTATDVSPDLKRSTVYVSLYGCDDITRALALLNDNSGKFRHALGENIRLRNLPSLDFCLDESIEQGDQISQLLGKLNSDSSDG